MFKPFCNICDELIINSKNRGVDDERYSMNLRIAENIDVTILLKSENVHVCKRCIAEGISNAINNTEQAE